MEKVITLMRYKVWLTISIMAALFLVVISFPPNSMEDEFPLFNDLISIFIFVPASFILSSSLISLLKDAFKNINIWVIISFISLITLLIVGLKLLAAFSVVTAFIILTTGILIGCCHFGITIFLKNNIIKNV